MPVARAIANVATGGISGALTGGGPASVLTGGIYNPGQPPPIQRPTPYGPWGGPIAGPGGYGEFPQRPPAGAGMPGMLVNNTPPGGYAAGQPAPAGLPAPGPSPADQTWQRTQERGRAQRKAAKVAAPPAGGGGATPPAQ